MISNPAPLFSWQRQIVATGQNWPEDRDEWTNVPFLVEEDRPLIDPSKRCIWRDFSDLRRQNSQLDAYLFWSRAPFLERAPDGSVLLRDARFYDPRARDRFTVALPDVKCEELPADPSR